MTTTVEITPVITEVNITTSVIEITPVGPTTIVEVSAGIPRLDLTLDDDLGVDLTVDGVLVTLTAFENLSFGDVCYLTSSNKWAKADATAEATARALAMATDTIIADATGRFLLMGFARNDAWNWSAGGELYLSETPGQFVQTAPTTSDSVTQVLGIALTADRIYFNPSMDVIVHI